MAELETRLLALDRQIEQSALQAADPTRHQLIQTLPRLPAERAHFFRAWRGLPFVLRMITARRARTRLWRSLMQAILLHICAPVTHWEKQSGIEALKDDLGTSIGLSLT